jgi:hypothetical protein
MRQTLITRCARPPAHGGVEASGPHHARGATRAVRQCDETKSDSVRSPGRSSGAVAIDAGYADSSCPDGRHATLPWSTTDARGGPGTHIFSGGGTCPTYPAAAVQRTVQAQRPSTRILESGRGRGAIVLCSNKIAPGGPIPASIVPAVRTPPHRGDATARLDAPRLDSCAA